MTQLTVELTDIFCPAFYPVHCAIWDEHKTEIWLKGGRGSSKSSFTAIEIVLGIMRDPQANAVCLRKVGDTLRTSVFSTLLWAIETIGVAHLFNATVSPPEITYLPTRQKIILKGLDDPMKMKSIKARNGYFKFLWFEEASEFSGMDEIRSVEQSVLRGGEKFVEFVTYNPPNDPAAWVNKESLNQHNERLIHASTYLEMPRAWLGEKFIERAERLKELDLLKYQHEYLGEAVGRAEQIVFYGKWQEKAFEAPPLSEIYQSRFFYGADWGFANDPTAILRCFIMVENGKMNLYIDYEAGGVGIEFEDIPALFEKIPDVRRWKIYADSQRPDTISYMERKSFHIVGAEKGKGSVEDGVEYIKSFDKVYIHPRCKETINEFMKYSYKIDRNTQEILPVLVDAYNHYIDACIIEGQFVITSKGNVLIENIKVGDFVLTRNGYKEVEQAIYTGEKEIWEIQISGKILFATENHKIYTTKGFIRVDALRYNDVCLIIEEGNLCKLNFVSLMAKNIIGILKATNTNEQKLVHANVGRVQKTNKIAKVYDLAIKDCPEFFASGVLVHNCRYALNDYIKTNVSIFDVL